MIVRVCTTHTDKLIPRNTELSRVTTHILTKQALVEIVMTSRNWSMYSVK